MKKIITLLALVALIGTAQAQYISGPTPQSVWSYTSPVRILGNAVSNIPVASAKVLKVGPLGFGISATIGMTNETSITNGTFFVFEQIASITGTNAVTFGNGGIPTNTFLVPVYAGTGSVGFYYWTNINPQLAAYTQLGNIPGIRLKSINPTNDPSPIYITNMHIWTR